MADAPEDIILDIFLRTSIKTLLYAKCVCKKWYDIIRNTGFIDKHMQWEKNHNKSRLLLQYYKEYTKEFYYALFDDETLVKDTFHDFVQPSVCSSDIDGPVNGLYCLFNHNDRIVIWNPASMQFRTIPFPHLHFFPDLKVFKGNVGFGMDHITDDFKLILIRSFGHPNNGPHFRYFTLYNLTTNTWRLLYDIGHWQASDDASLYHSSILREQSRLFLDGNFYWWIPGCVSGFVVAFDMRLERFRDISLPEVSKIWKWMGSALILYDEMVALSLSMELFVDIWVMLEVGVWIKQFSIISLPLPFVVFGHLSNEFCFRNEEYTNDPVQMILYNATTREMRNVGPKGVHLCFRAIIYRESLVSVDNGLKHKDRVVTWDTISKFLNSSSSPYLDM